MTPQDGGRGGTTVVVVSAALFADSLLYSAVVPVLPVYAEENGASTAAIGLLFASYAAALLAATPVVAVVGDIVGQRRMLVAGMTAVTVATLLFAVADSYGGLLAARSLQGAAAAVVWTSGVALVADQVEESRHGTVMGLVMADRAADPPGDAPAQRAHVGPLVRSRRPAGPDAQVWHPAAAVPDGRGRAGVDREVGCGRWVPRHLRCQARAGGP